MDIIEFLHESNAIESEYSDIALKDAKKAWDFMMRQDKLNDNVLLKAHQLLMQSINPRIAGRFRNCDIYIGGKMGAKPYVIQTLLDSWYLDVETSLKVPGKDGDNFRRDHITFEGIHPFEDGNGRIGRIILNWERVKSGLPILIIHQGNEQMEYYKWFH